MQTGERTEAERLAAFIVSASYDRISPLARQRLKIHLLDSIGCAIGALGGEPIRKIREQYEDFGVVEMSHGCTLIGGGKTAPDRAAFYNTALIRYLDFMDSYLVAGETCHPSDNIGAVLAACEYAESAGKDFLTALAVAYQVECRLTDEAPILQKGFDHTTQLAYSVAAGVSKALGLDEEKTANAVAIAGTDFTSLAVVRAAPGSMWKGLASAATAMGATHSTFLAMRGVTGPMEVFEGPKGFRETLKSKFSIDWSREGLDRVTGAILKRYDAEIHTQSALEGALELKEAHGFGGEEVDRVEVRIFPTAYAITGGGELGDRTRVAIKEQADHSLPYLIAVALLDGRVTPEQLLPARIARDDVQRLLRRVEVRPIVPLEKPRAIVEHVDPTSRRYPQEMPCHLAICLKDGRRLEIEKRDYEGFRTRPLSWAQAAEKFDALTSPYANEALRRELQQAVAEIESIRVSDLTGMLALVSWKS